MQAFITIPVTLPEQLFDGGWLEDDLEGRTDRNELATFEWKRIHNGFDFIPGPF